jgi:hypothetical protein
MGVMRILDHLEMFKMDNAYNDELDPPPPTTVLCSKGFWVSMIDFGRCWDRDIQDE